MLNVLHNIHRHTGRVDPQPGHPGFVMRAIVITLVVLASPAPAHALSTAQARHAITRAWAKYAFNVSGFHCRHKSTRRVSCKDITQFPGVLSACGTDTVTLSGTRLLVHLDWHRR